MSFNLKEYLKEKQNLINTHLQETFVEEKNFPLYKSMQYSLFAEGKRIRPILCLASCEAVGGEEKNALNTACALEYIHTYSLIHDDLPAMDNDNLRRGKPTNHKVFGDATAILAGDALLTHAFSLVSQDENLNNAHEIIKVLSNRAGYYGMVGGQQYDMMVQGKDESLDFIINLHKMKTAALIEVSLVCGAIAGNADSKTKSNLASFGENIGIAFQITDDILDEIGGEKIGKDIGSDKEKGKLTICKKLDVMEAKTLANKYLENGIESISMLENNSILKELAYFIVKRQH